MEEDKSPAPPGLRYEVLKGSIFLFSRHFQITDFYLFTTSDIKLEDETKKSIQCNPAMTHPLLT